MLPTHDYVENEVGAGCHHTDGKFLCRLSREEHEAPRFYGSTWHDTRENAMKCPPCKEVVLAEEAAAALEADHDSAVVEDRQRTHHREQDAYALVRQGLRVLVPPSGVIRGPAIGSALYTGKPGTIVHVCPRNGMKVTDVERCLCEGAASPSGRHTYQPSPSNRCAYRYPAGIGCGHPEKHELHGLPNPIQWQIEQQNRSTLAGNPFAGKFFNRDF